MLRKNDRKEELGKISNPANITKNSHSENPGNGIPDPIEQTGEKEFEKKLRFTVKIRTKFAHPDGYVAEENTLNIYQVRQDFRNFTE